MGAGDLDHRQFAQQCDLYTGGLHVSPHVTQHHTNLCGYDQGVLLSSHCLDRHLPYMLSLWEDVFTRYALHAVPLGACVRQGRKTAMCSQSMPDTRQCVEMYRDSW